MREIKFRAWDKRNKRMIKNEDILRIYMRFREIDYILAREVFSITFEEADIMQYTGLKDKNGTEIYEGDIVKAWSEGKSAVGKVMQRIDGLWLLYPAWQGKEFWGLCPNSKGNTTVEVIGNIYENPELLG